MTVATDLLDCLAEVGAKVEAAGNRLVVRAGEQPVPAGLVRRLRESKAEVLAALAVAATAAEAAWWRRHFVIRTIDRGLSGARSPAEAAHIAWGELQNRWHLAHGERVPRELCAGCRHPIADWKALDLIDGNRLHGDNGNGCLIRWGERWRGAATEALAAMGLRPPSEER
jgi:hypothetical protein